MGELLTEHDGGGGVDGDGFRGHFPVPAACRNRDSVPRNGVSRWRRRPWSLSGVSSIGVGFSRREGLYRRKGSARGVPRGPPHKAARPPLGRAATMCGGPGPLLWPLFGALEASLKYKILGVDFVQFREYFLTRISETKNSRKQELALRHLVNRLVPENA